MGVQAVQAECRGSVLAGVVRGCGWGGGAGMGKVGGGWDLQGGLGI